MTPEQIREQIIKDYKTTQEKIENGEITFYEDNGSSYEDAIIINGTNESRYGIKAEYFYIAIKHGKRGKDWQLVSQGLGGDNKANYDIITIKDLKTGEEKTYYFNITKFFGR